MDLGSGGEHAQENLGARLVRKKIPVHISQLSYGEVFCLQRLYIHHDFKKNTGSIISTRGEIASW